MSAHSPAPWIYRTGSGGQIDCRNGTVVQPNAISWGPDGDLIAAAPALLAACKKLIEWDAAENNAPAYDSDNGAHFRMRVALYGEAAELARSAVAKAEGR